MSARSLVVCGVLVAGCHAVEEDAADERDDSFLIDGKSDGIGIPEGGPEALGILEVVNTLSFEALDASEAVGLDSRAAKSIVEARNGADTILGTEDDHLFAMLWELDAVPYVGPIAINRLLDYALAQGYVVEVPELVNIRVVGAIIGFGMSNGEQWDFNDWVSPDLMQTVADALVGPSPYTEILALLARPAVQQLSKPDPIGSASVNGGNWVRLANTQNNTEDTFQPVWPNQAVFTNVAYNDNLRVQVYLQDEDLFLHDDIALVELNHRDIRDAYLAEQVFAVQVADQSNHQLLFVTISVTAP